MGLSDARLRDMTPSAPVRTLTELSGGRSSSENTGLEIVLW